MNEKYKIKYLKYKNRYIILKNQIAGMDELPNLHHNDCSICGELIDENDPIRLCFTNNHMFHTACINKWLTIRNTCPYCNTIFAPPQPEPAPQPAPLLNLNRANLLVHFPDLPNLRTITLEYNQIRTIEPQTFQNLPNLRQIVLHNNQIRNIEPQAFQNLPRLERIELYINLIEHIDPQTFQDLPNLQQIYLMRNPLQNIDQLRASLPRVRIGF